MAGDLVDHSTGSSPEPAAVPQARAGAPGDLDVVIRNLGSGQIIELEVRGDWTEPALEERLLKLIEIRQPAELRVSVSPVAGAAPDLRTSRAALAAYGGTITVVGSG